ncbi:MAG: aldo/keto reductase [Chloroflexi bacterium]|nr:aldo/keto reductase [Chloroflexota bacterium]
MEYRNLGRAGLKVSPLCLGTNTFGGTIDDRAAAAVLDAYVELGGNFVDTANSYSGKGGAERAIGQWLKDRGRRERVVIASKVQRPMGPGPNDTGLSRGHIMNQIEASLKRLQTDYLDLYYSHFDDVSTPQEETLRAHDDLVRQGKVRYIGVSNTSAWRIVHALWTSDKHGFVHYEVVQPKYNLVERQDYERDLEPMVREMGLGVATYTSLAQGFLTGKYRSGRDLPATPRADRVESRYMTERNFRVLAAVDEVAAGLGATAPQVALAWIQHRPGITASIAGSNTPDQVRELFASTELRLDSEALRKLDEASK